MKTNSQKPEKSEELEEYIRATLFAIKKGVESGTGFSVYGLIEFDLAVTKIKSGDGRFKIFVADLKGVKKTETISRLKFRVRQDSKQKGQKQEN